jgi:hypothetical protein
MILALRAIPWLRGRHAIRGAICQAPLAAVVGWTLITYGQGACALATVLPMPGAGVLAAEGWLVTAIGAPLVATMRARRPTAWEGS